MEITMIKSTGRKWIGATPTDRTRTVAVGLGVCMFAAATVYAMVDGPRRHGALEQAAAAAEEEESQAVCSRLGISPSASGYAACAFELAAVRERREERVGRRSAGF
jgi:hypothetical protein